MGSTPRMSLLRVADFDASTSSWPTPTDDLISYTGECQFFHLASTGSYPRRHGAGLPVRIWSSAVPFMWTWSRSWGYISWAVLRRFKSCAGIIRHVAESKHLYSLNILFFTFTCARSGTERHHRLNVALAQVPSPVPWCPWCWSWRWWWREAGEQGGTNAKPPS